MCVGGGGEGEGGDDEIWEQSEPGWKMTPDCVYINTYRHVKIYCKTKEKLYLSKPFQISERFTTFK